MVTNIAPRSLWNITDIPTIKFSPEAKIHIKQNEQTSVPCIHYLCLLGSSNHIVHTRLCNVYKVIMYHSNDIIMSKNVTDLWNLTFLSLIINSKICAPRYIGISKYMSSISFHPVFSPFLFSKKILIKCLTTVQVWIEACTFGSFSWTDSVPSILVKFTNPMYLICPIFQSLKQNSITLQHQQITSFYISFYVCPNCVCWPFTLFVNMWQIYFKRNLFTYIYINYSMYFIWHPSQANVSSFSLAQARQKCMCKVKISSQK